MQSNTKAVSNEASATKRKSKATAKKTAAKGPKTKPLGNKGMETRRTLMEATRRLLDKASPLTVTAAAISKEAGTAPATFYVYFDNVEDVFWALCDSISQDTSELFPSHDTLRNPDRLEEDALAFIKGYSEIWSRHAPLLLLRNLEADRGNKRFYQLVLRIALPILQGITDRIVEASSPEHPVTRSEANAEAVVLIAAMDRIAAAIHLYPEDSLMPDVLQRAQARVLARMLAPR